MLSVFSVISVVKIKFYVWSEQFEMPGHMQYTQASQIGILGSIYE